jgi:hypothetical protein
MRAAREIVVAGKDSFLGGPRMRAGLAVTATLVALAAFGTSPNEAAAATCSDYPNQAAAQRAADTRDGDGDGVYCEALPCPCSTDQSGVPPEGSTRIEGTRRACVKPPDVQNISFSKRKYPNIRSHFLRALRNGWPRILVLNRVGADARRERLLAGVPPKTGFDRDEYPPAVGRGVGPGLMRGLHPIGWMADVEYVPSAENRSHGSTLGTKLRRLCDGTRFRYVFY